MTRFGAFLLSLGKDHFYIMHLSYDGDKREELWDYARNNDIIGLSHSEVNGNWENVRDKASRLIGRGWARQFDYFCRMQRDDLVIVLNGMDSVLGVAKITQPKHKYNDDLSDVFFDHTRQVEWIEKCEYTKRRRLPNLVRGFSNTLSKVPRDSPRWPLFANLEI